ncbi:hypothetical protein RZS08_01885, partial [Arthrospira platensis SPKY1]|nr:hypothetical protein [Arthrospira platensis SPKY1]
ADAKHPCPLRTAARQIVDIDHQAREQHADEYAAEGPDGQPPTRGAAPQVLRPQPPDDPDGHPDRRQRDGYRDGRELHQHDGKQRIVDRRCDHQCAPWSAMSAQG